MFCNVYSIPQTVSEELQNTIFASKYQTVLPSKEELKQLIDNKK
jgi:hypothetical protein